MLGRAALHPSVTRRAAPYESHSPRVSIQPSKPKAVRPIPAHAKSFQDPNRPHGSNRELHRECRGRRCRGVHRGCADPRVELVFRRLHAWTLKDSPQGSQPGGNASLCQNVSGCFRTCQSDRMPPPAARRNAPGGALVPVQVSGDEIARRSLRARHGDTRFEGCLSGWTDRRATRTTPNNGRKRTSCSVRSSWLAGRAMGRPLVVADQSSTYPLVSDFDPNHWSTAE